MGNGNGDVIYPAWYPKPCKVNYDTSILGKKARILYVMGTVGKDELSVRIQSLDSNGWTFESTHIAEMKELEITVPMKPYCSIDEFVKDIEEEMRESERGAQKRYSEELQIEADRMRERGNQNSYIAQLVTLLGSGA